MRGVVTGVTGVSGWMVGDQAVAQAGLLRSFARAGLQIGAAAGAVQPNRVAISGASGSDADADADAGGPQLQTRPGATRPIPRAREVRMFVCGDNGTVEDGKQSGALFSHKRNEIGIGEGCWVSVR